MDKEKLFRKFEDKAIQTVLRDYKIDVVLTPKKENPTTSNKKRGRPKKDEVNNKMDRILSVLEEKYPKGLYLPDIYDSLGVVDSNRTMQHQYKYALDKLVSKRKVEKGKDDDGHSIYRVIL